MNTRNALPGNLSVKLLTKYALQGAAIALVLVFIFLLFFILVGDVLTGKSFWQGAWEFFPLVTVPVGGALGGIIYCIIVHAWSPTSWKKTLAATVAILNYLALLWLFLVLGFAATGQWD